MTSCSIRRVALLLLLLLSAIPWLPPAEGRAELAWFHGIRIPDCVGKRCCDDYHAKPLPPVRAVKKFCWDDYCPKPLPPALPVKQFCCDDYCPKLWPKIHCPPCGPLTCPPPWSPCPPGRCPAPSHGNAVGE